MACGICPCHLKNFIPHSWVKGLKIKPEFVLSSSQLLVHYWMSLHVYENVQVKTRCQGKELPRRHTHQPESSVAIWWHSSDVLHTSPSVRNCLDQTGLFASSYMSLSFLMERPLLLNYFVQLHKYFLKCFNILSSIKYHPLNPASAADQERIKQAPDSHFDHSHRPDSTGSGGLTQPPVEGIVWLCLWGRGPRKLSLGEGTFY